MRPGATQDRRRYPFSCPGSWREPREAAGCGGPKVAGVAGNLDSQKGLIDVFGTAHAKKEGVFCDKQLTKKACFIDFEVFGWQHVSSAGFPTPTSLASAARIFLGFSLNVPGLFS